MKTPKVRVLLYSTPPQQDYLEFELIFEDNSQKYFKLSSFEISLLGRSGLRAVFEDQAQLYYELLGEAIDGVSLIFL